MAFQKSFPLTIKGTTYPKWIDIALSDEEEQAVERQANEENSKMLVECIKEAKKNISFEK